MNILFLSTALPPHYESQTIRSLYLIEQLASLGYTFTFVTPSVLDGRDESLYDFLPTNCEFVRTLPSFFDRVNHKLKKLPFGGTLAWAFSNLYATVAVPDPRKGWDRLAVQSCESVLRDKVFDVVFSSSGSFTAHMAAYVISSRYGIPWLADLGDPWSVIEPEMNVIGRIRRKNSEIEKRIIPQCAGIIFTTEQTQEAYRHWLGKNMPPSVVIPYGYRAGDFELQNDFAPSVEKLLVAHLGVAYRRNRNLEHLIRAVHHLEQEQIEFHIIGPHSNYFRQISRKLRTKNVSFRERVEYKESLRIMRDADALVILGNRGTLQIPGKAYMCLASGKPLLYIGQQDSAKDPTYKLVSRFKGVLCCSNDEGQIRETLVELKKNYEEFAATAIDRRKEKDLLDYSSESLAKSLHKFIVDLGVEGRMSDSSIIDKKDEAADLQK